MVNHVGDVLDLVKELSRAPRGEVLKRRPFFRGVHTPGGTIVVIYYGTDFNVIPQAIDQLRQRGGAVGGTYSRLTLFPSPSR